MLVKTIGKKYASALFGVAGDLERIDEIKTALETFAACMNKEAFVSFKNPKLSLAVKQAALRKSINGKLPTELVGFLCLLIAKKRFEFLPEIVKEFNILYDEKHGLKSAVVVSAFEVTKTQQELIKNTLEKRYSSKFLVDFSVDASLLGGIIINIGNEMIDGSLKNQLAKIKTRLLS